MVHAKNTQVTHFCVTAGGGKLMPRSAPAWQPHIVSSMARASGRGGRAGPAPAARFEASATNSRHPASHSRGTRQQPEDPLAGSRYMGVPAASCARRLRSPLTCSL